MTYHTDAWSAGARGAVTKWWICRTTGFAACTRGPARMIAFVDLALALMPPRGRNDDPAFGNYVDLKSEWKRQLEEIVGAMLALKPLCQTCQAPIGMQWCEASGFVSGVASTQALTQCPR
jgi:hypothetical protein